MLFWTICSQIRQNQGWVGRWPQNQIRLPCVVCGNFQFDNQQLKVRLIVSKGRMIVEIQSSTSYFTSKLSTCLLVVRIYPIHIKIIGVVQRYVLCPSLSFFCVIIIFTYVFKHGCACLKLEFGRFQIFQQIYQFEGTVEYRGRGT